MIFLDLELHNEFFQKAVFQFKYPFPLLVGLSIYLLSLSSYVGLSKMNDYCDAHLASAEKESMLS